MTRTVRRLLRAESLIRDLLRAWDNSEAANFDAVMEKLRKFISEV